MLLRFAKRLPLRVLVKRQPLIKPLITTKLMSTKTDAEWRVVLTPEQFRVLRQKGKLAWFKLESLEVCSSLCIYRNGTSRNR